MTYLRGAATACAFSILAACAAGTSATRTGTAPIDQSFQAGGVTFGPTAEMVMLFKARENSGQVEVCGAIVTYGPGLYQSGEHQVLQGAFLRANGVTIANSITYFARLPRQGGELDFADVAGMSANCALTGTVWQPSFEGAEIDMVLRSKSVQL